MNDDHGAGFEDRLRAALLSRARSVSAPADATAVTSVAHGARRRHSRRRWEAATLAVVVVMAVGLSVVVTSGGGAPRQVAGHAGFPGGRLDRRDGVLVLPLTGTVSASYAGDEASHGGGSLGVTPNRAFNGTGSTPAQGQTGSGVPNASTPSTTTPIDVAPSSSTSLQRLYGHTSPDGVRMTVFDQPAGGAASGGAASGGAASGGAASGGAASGGAASGGAASGGAASGLNTVSPPSSGPASPPPISAEPATSAPGASQPAGLAPDGPGCLTTTQLTVEISDTDAVGTMSEPLFQGATGALVDVQVGEIGQAEGAPATWVLAQVGTAATTVEVQFADGSIDQVAVPSSGVVVLGHTGAPDVALGNGSAAAIDVLGSAGQVLAGYGLGTTSSVATGAAAPSALPAPGSVQPADPAAATAAVTRAVETALGCRASPVQRLNAMAGGDALETVPFSGTAEVDVVRVVFTAAAAAVVEYHLNDGQGAQSDGPLYAAATLSGDAWQLSLASVAPQIQVTPANQVGNVTVAPTGQLFVKRWPDGTAVAVYKALPGSQSSGYGTGDAACTPAGGIVEEVTTPGAVAVLTSALFPNYTSPLISAAVSSVGGAEGAPATVVDVEVGPQVTTLSVTGSTGTVTESPRDGAAVVVLGGDPVSALGATGSQLQVSDGSGTALATVPLQVEASAPAGPSALPATLPAAPPAGAGQPADPQAATQAISAAFAAVFDCSTPPIQRVQSIEDGSLVSGALEQLDTGPYEALASSTYIDVNTVVFESPTVADVAYTLRFHSDAQLTFPMVGQALIVDGGWRVSYATVCAAIQLGLGNCQT